MLTSRHLTAVGFIIAITWLIVTASIFQSSREEPAASSAVAATVDGRPITMQEVEQAAAIPLYQLDLQRNQLLHRTLQQKIEEHLLEAEASLKGISVSELLNEATQSESITRLANLPAPVRQLNSDKNQNNPRQKSRQSLQEQARIRQALLVSLRRKTDIRIAMKPMDPPTLSVSADDDPFIGPADAPVTIVEFSDFQCAYCQKSVVILKELRHIYGEKIRLVYRDYPGPNHPHAAQAAEAAQCAGEQGKFWEYHDVLFDRQTAGTGWDYEALARDLGLHTDDFSTCLRTGRYREEVKKDLQDGLALGITSTPTFFINGRPLVGAQPAAEFSRLIDPLLPQ